MEAQFLDRTPHLKGVFYGAGSIRGLVTDAFWEKDIPIVSAYAANAVPVVHYTLACIILALKNALPISRAYTRARGNPSPKPPNPGIMNGRVGLISLGMIARQLLPHLQEMGIQVHVYDPFLPPQMARELGVQLMTLDELFASSEVVSLHTPLLPATRGLITGEHLARIPPHGTFINTARGAVVREDEMIAVLQKRPDIQAFLDVTYPEPPEEESPLYDLPNVFLTPHIAGSIGRECWRMGNLIVEELERHFKGEELRWRITREQAETMA